MTTSLALLAGHHLGWGHGFGPGFGFGFGFPIFLVLAPLFWIAVIALIVGLSRRRFRRGGWGGPGFGGYGAGAWGHGGYGQGWASAGQQAARSAESTLAERFAQGDIDEKEYRARLEVLRANSPQQPTGPVPPQD